MSIVIYIETWHRFTFINQLRMNSKKRTTFTLVMLFVTFGMNSVIAAWRLYVTLYEYV